MAKSILHITAGSDDWDPTQEELDQLVQMFMDAKCDPNDAVVVTRTGVTAKVVDVSAVEGLTVISAHCDSPEGTD